METGKFVNLILASLCSNYQPDLVDRPEFKCLTKTEEQLSKDVLRGKKLKILSYDDYPLNQIEVDDEGVLHGKGISFELLEKLQEIYGFQYDLIKAPVRSIGDQNSGILGMVASEEVDMVAGFLPVLPGTHDYISWGTELSQNMYYIMMNRPHESASENGLLAPFDTVVWLLILVSVLAVGPVMYSIIWLRNRFSSNVQVLPLHSCFWFVYGALMKQGSTLSPATDSSRIMFATWWIFILILTAFYTANLTAFLTLSLFTLPIKTIEDVAKPQNHWFSASGGSVEYSITSKDDGDLDILTASVEKGTGKFIDTTQPQIVLKMLSEGWMYMDDSSTLTRLMFDEYQKKTKNGIDESKRCTYVLTEDYFLKRSLAFAYPKKSILPSLFNPVVQSFVESGILKHLSSEGLPVAPICPLNLGSKERRLRNSDLATTYYVVVSGFAIALAVFLSELLFRHCCSRRPEPKLWPKPAVVKKPKTLVPFGLDKYAAFKDQIQRSINGRDYMVITSKDGNRRFIPMRTPSALLFQYS